MHWSDRRTARGLRTALLLASLLPLGACAWAAARIPGTEAEAQLRAENRWQDLLEQQRARHGALDSAPSGDDRPAEAHLAEGDQHLEQGNLSKASVSYLRAHYRDPAAEAPLSRIGFLALARDPAGSGAYFEDLLARNPEDPEAMLGLGISQLVAGELDEALGTLEAARAQRPGARVLAVLGVAYDRAGEPEAAQEAHRAALALRPGEAGVLNNLGISLLLSQRPAEAAEVFRQGRAAAPADRALANNLGIALAFTGAYRQALDSFASVGTRGDALNNLGYALMLKGELEAARRFFEEALLSNETDERRVLQNLSLLDQIETAPVPVGPALGSLEDGLTGPASQASEDSGEKAPN